MSTSDKTIRGHGNRACHTKERLTLHASSILIWLTFLYCAAAVNFSWIQSWHNSDTVIHALISIDRYSPFYWSENRFGMLVPLLASPVRDYAWNLLVQSQILVVAGIGVLTLLNAFDRPLRPASPVLRISMAGLLLLAFFKPLAAVVLLLGGPYFLSLFLVLSALHVLLECQRWPAARWIGAAILLLLSFWVNVSNMVIALIAAAAWPRIEFVPLRTRLGALALVIASAAAILAFSSQFRGAEFRQLQPWTEWAGSIGRVAGNLPILMYPAAALAAIAAAVALQLMRRKAWKYAPADALVLGALCQILATAASTWVARNAYDARYILGPVFVILAVALFILVGPAAAGIERLSGPATASFACCLLCLAITTRVFGFPSPRSAIAQIERATSDVAAPVERLSCTHVIGNYWYVWETVFHDRMRTGERRLWGVTHRADVTRDLWTAMPVSERRYCALCSDTQVEHMRATEGVGPLRKEFEESGICVFREVP